ncbi:hypothetical protein DYB30_007853 [Aphanomyces astaci]|uniref:non-specific serine/threonine protein kinase n=1 Tax=Aphanomyces astaci TaxID=112090 RepID=A0A397DIU6_APHAT|nr:hypothetical protein DYB30_007853 [Aphanomyces astaci]
MFRSVASHSLLRRKTTPVSSMLLRLSHTATAVEASDRFRVVIVGTGWAGYKLLINGKERRDDIERALGKPVDFVVISERNHFLYTPLLASTTVGTLEFRSITEPVRESSFRHEQDFVLASVQSIDTESKQVQCQSTLSTDLNYKIDYDMLVVACGSVPSTFGLPGVTEDAFFLKEVHHAREIRRRILENFELATQPGVSEATQRQLLHFIVVGGGPTGIEFCAELYDFVNEDLARLYPQVGQIMSLIDAGEILSMFNASLRERAMRKIENRQSMRIIKHNCTELKLQLPSAVFAIGDCADIENYPLPATAQKAQGQALYLLELLQRTKPSVEPYRFESMGMMAYLGSYEGLFQAKEVTINKQHQPLATFDGWKAWLVWRSAYLTKLGSWRLRLQVPLDWFKAMVVGRDVGGKPVVEECTPLMLASWLGHDGIVDLLVAYDSSLVNLANHNKTNALMLACMNNHWSAVQTLLSVASLDVNAINMVWIRRALILACASSSKNVVDALLSHHDIDVNMADNTEETALHVAADVGEGESAYPSALFRACRLGFEDIVQLLLSRDDLDVHADINTGTLLVVAMAPCMTPAAGVALLLRDLPVIVSVTTPTPTIVATDKHHYSWTTFLDSSTPIKPEIRLETVQLVLDHPQFKALDRHSVVKELAFAADINGRTALQITDAATRTFLNEQLFFCGRYELFDGPPIHISSTAVVVNAFDYGMFKQVFDMHAAALDHHLDRDGFAKCSHALGQPSSQTTKNHNGTLSEVEFMRYCDQAYGGKLKVAMKFMRNADEHAREIHMRRGLTKDDEENAGSPCVLRLLPMASQEAFECHVTQLTLHHDLHMAAYPNVLVMPAADRSLEDIYLKERPNDNQIRSMLQEVATMLGQLHSHDVVHGDVKKLNVLRVDHCMRLIDMDAATPVNHPIGAKFSSGSLPPEMFYKLKSEDEVAQYSSYWQQRNHPEKTKNEADDDDERPRHDPDWWAKVQPRHHWVVKTFHDKDHHLLPYTLVKATPAVDMWAFGVLMYQMYSGVELVPTDRNQDVDDSSIERAATWTPADLATRLQNKVANPVARDLLLKLLAVDPNDRISVHAMLGHAYFEIKQVDSTTKQVLSAIEAKLDTLNDHVVSGFQSMNDRLDLVVELTQDTLKQLGQAKEDLMRGIFQATEVRVPTSFVLLPFNIMEKLADDDDVNDVEGALDEAASFIQKGLDMGAKFVKAVKTNKAINVVVKLVTPGAPLYLYLIDEVQGAPVVPPLDKASPPVYPIKIETKSDEYVAFMVTAMPYIQTGFKLLKGVNTVACMAKALGVPSLDADVLQGVQDKIERAKKTSSVFDFGVLQTAVEANDPGAPVHRIRGAALRQLERFFELHDPDKDFAGLGRTYAASGQVLWTAKSTIEAFERSKAQPKSANISFAGDIPMLLESGNKKTLTAQDVYAKLLRQQPPETTRKERWL